MFHFLQVSNPYLIKKVPLDYEAFRIVGFDDVYSFDYQADSSIVKRKNHCIYGFCNNSTDSIGIGHLIYHEAYVLSACIRKYYDVDKQKYYNTGEERFRWPTIEKGC